MFVNDKYTKNIKGAIHIAPFIKTLNDVTLMKRELCN